MEKEERRIPDKPPIGTGFDAFNGLLGNTMKNLERLKTKGMGDYGLSGTHTLCLRQLYEIPEGLTRTELAKLCGVDRAQITRVIGDLLQKGLAKEMESGSNYRKKCALTAEGRQIAADINDRVQRLVRFVSGNIEEERLESFYRTLAEICENLERAEKYL